ncbi:MAG: hypothetical protein U0797_07730 [Gemmataceae bacterium]
MKNGINRIALTFAVAALGAATPASTHAQGADHSAQIAKLEERVRDLEARLAKVEATQHSKMGMKMGMGMHKGGMPNQDPGTSAMGKAPQGAGQAGGGMMDDSMEMPPMGGNQPMGGGMPSGAGMGDM